MRSSHDIDDLLEKISFLEKENKELKNDLSIRDNNAHLIEALIKAIPMPLFLKDKSGKYMLVNNAFEDFSGLPQSEINGKTVYECWPSEEASVYHDKDIEMMENDNNQEYEYHIVHVEKGERDGIFTKACIHNDSGDVTGLVGFFLDITERKIAEEKLLLEHKSLETAVEQKTEELNNYNLKLLNEIQKRKDAQKELEERENLLSAIYENAPFMLFGIDKKGEVVLWNRALENALGWRKEELGEFPGFFSNFFSEEKELERVLNDYNSGDKTFREYRITDKNGNNHIHSWASFLIGNDLYAGFGYDITEQKSLEKEREELLAEFETIFNNSSIGIGFLKEGRYFHRINKRGCEILGYSESDLIGKSVEIVHISEPDFREFGEKYYKRLVSGNVIQAEVQMKKKSGEIIWCSLYGKAIIPPDLEKGVIWIVEDITEKRIYEKKLYYMAIKDDLTSLYNRRYFFDKAESIIGRVKRYRKDLTAAIIDIDYFKNVNDSYGHDTGDKVLKEIASAIDSCIRETDLLARYGGEEFSVLMEETNIYDAETVMERIRLKVSSLSFKDGFSISVSAGCAQWKTGESVDTLLKRADIALYMAKGGGRNRVEYSK